jgi:hypothetical protein
MRQLQAVAKIQLHRTTKKISGKHDRNLSQKLEVLLRPAFAFCFTIAAQQITQPDS